MTDNIIEERLKAYTPKTIENEEHALKEILQEMIENEELKPGGYEITWDASNYSSGIYFYKIQAGDYSKTKRMVVIK